MIPFSVQVRNSKLKPHQLREEDILPGVVYGGKENLNIQVPIASFKKVLHEAGRSNIINLDIEGKKVLSLLKDFQLHPLTDKFIHFDLLEVDSNKEIRVQIPIKTVGTPKGVKEGGLLELLQEYVEVACKVQDIPTEFEVDVTSLEIGFSVHLSSLNAPNGVRFTQDSSTVLVVVTGESDAPKDESSPE